MPRPPRIAFGSYTLAPDGKGPDAEGRWLWRLEWYPKGESGKQRTKGIGRHLEVDVETAAHRAILDLGAVAPKSATPTTTISTWDHVLGAWLAHARRESVHAGVPAPRTVDRYATIVGYLRRPLGALDLPATALELEDHIRGARDLLLVPPDGATGLAPSTVRAALGIASVAYAWAARRDLITAQAWPRIALRVDRPQRHLATPEEARAVLEALRAHIATRRPRNRPPHDWPLVAYALHWSTAPRIGELAALTLADVELDREGVWYGRHQGNRKTGARFAVADAGTVEILAAYLAAMDLRPSDRLWPVTVDSFDHNFWSTWIRPAIAAAGLPQWTGHAVRSVMADHLAGAAVDGKSATAQLGNTEVTRLVHYRRPLEDPLREAIATRSIVDAEPPPERPTGGSGRRTLRRTLRRTP